MKRRILMLAAALAVLVVVAVAVKFFVVDRRGAGPQQAPSNSASSVLALTWAPSLCRVEPAASGCRSGHVGRLGQSLLLHGLWPQPSTEQYCDVPKRDAGRRSVELTEDIRITLQDMMSDEKVLAPHEWYAHGTCSGVSPSEYFGISATFTAQVTKVLNPIFEKARGRQLAPRSVREALDAEFGEGTGQRAGLTCRNPDGRGPVVYEVRLSLPPVVDIRGEKSLGDALARGPAIPAGCGKGRVP